ncbi:MAG: ADP/ATP-dependent (S)-NAD(P)H-hydrate dehydratase, partial [Myxococcota bacterium]
AERFIDAWPTGRPLVIDADALHPFASRLEVLRSREPFSAVLTPHPGEAAALLGWSVDAVQADRFAAAAELRDRSGQVVVLKGARSLIAWEYVELCPYGGPSLAVGGSGDTLAGAIAALAVDTAPARAARLGVLAHALAGERLPRGAFASEIADALGARLTAAQRTSA